MILRIGTSSPAQTEAIAHRLGERLLPGHVLALVGDLGSGKTTWTRGLARGLGVPDTVRVSSPTYVLEQVYSGRLPVYHYDAYRLSSVDELLSIGFEERLLGSGVVVVEWADRVLSALPRERLLLEMDHVIDTGLDHRLLTFSGCSDLWSDLLAGLELI